ncbi:flagellar biosynthetic protein FliO [Heyndrickxia sporothermodurans]|uniref:flagellar biosynthetic protein FliO n=1 Tax=Heyndrickxia sporothermodurans TaxID=46224 RepID=UPI002E1F6921|nr:flagellar biosynthetic protein FliO [Heyndrickxia sporothermodurans]MED3649898.1 flagellar biosynthetic protein FliO [Heyndrickxia sporothermodurans]MED3697884.1 flagellar biosynthetic protein FliO [Heyndrickxia sporothermodurans]MED3781257.1 flagellar biosynthetic protein FliO [Heyndrickxia sporothermodurans]
MRKALLKLLTLVLLIIPLCGQHIVAHAETNNGNVQDWFKQHSNESKKDSKQEVEKNSKNSDTIAKTNNSIITVWDGVKMVFALLFVIALLYFLLKFINKKSRSYQQNRLIQNFGGTPLGGNRSLQIVKAGNRILILGVGEDIHLLKEIENQKEVEEFIQYYDDQVEQSLEPRDMITKLTKKYKQKKSDKDSSKTPSFQHILKNQLENMNKERRKTMNKLDAKEQETDE